jgi:hypothetical protein
MEGVITMIPRANALGFLAILAMPLAANAETTGKTETLTRSPDVDALYTQPRTLPDGPYRTFDLVGRLSRTRSPRKRVAVHISDRRKSERLGYKKVSSLVNFPAFFPGIGALFVQPKTLPNGPYRAFDRRGRLSSTIYMLPIEDFENRKQFDLEGLAGKGDHVTFYFNSGHPGLEKPHYHIHIWHVSKKGEARVAK